MKITKIEHHTSFKDYEKMRKWSYTQGATLRVAIFSTDCSS